MLMNRFFFKKSTPIIDLFVHEQGDEEYISLLTFNKGEIVLNKNMECVF